MHVLLLIGALGMSAGPDQADWRVQLPQESEVALPTDGALVFRTENTFGADISVPVVVELENAGGESVSGNTVLMQNYGIAVWRPDKPLTPDSEYFAVLRVADQWTPIGASTVSLSVFTDHDATPPLQPEHIEVTLTPTPGCEDGCCTPAASVVVDIGGGHQRELMAVDVQTGGRYFASNEWLPAATLGVSFVPWDPLCVRVDVSDILRNTSTEREVCMTYEELLASRPGELWCGEWTAPEVTEINDIPIDGPVVFATRLAARSGIAVGQVTTDMLTVTGPDGVPLAGTAHDWFLGLTLWIPEASLAAATHYDVAFALAHPDQIPLPPLEFSASFTTASAAAPLLPPQVVIAPDQRKCSDGCCRPGIRVTASWRAGLPAEVGMLSLRSYGLSNTITQAWPGDGKLTDKIAFTTRQDAYCVEVEAVVLAQVAPIARTVRCAAHDHLFVEPELGWCEDTEGKAKVPKDWAQFVGSSIVDPPQDTTESSDAEERAAGCTAGGEGAPSTAWVFGALLVLLTVRRLRP